MMDREVGNEPLLVEGKIGRRRKIGVRERATGELGPDPGIRLIRDVARAIVDIVRE
jgi:hypothetical protein